MEGWGTRVEQHSLPSCQGKGKQRTKPGWWLTRLMAPQPPAREQEAAPGDRAGEGQQPLGTDRWASWGNALCARFLTTLLRPPQQKGQSSAFP